MLISNTADMKYYFLVWHSRYSVAFCQGSSCKSGVMVFYILCPKKSPTQCRRATALQTWVSCHLLSGKECLGRGGMFSISREDTAILISYHVCQSCAQHKDSPAQAVPSCPVHVFHDPQYFHSPALDTTSKKTMKKVIKNTFFPLLIDILFCI